MLVVGLLSGGKDSVYNLLHCILNGHQPIALASLAPPKGKDELDSYMYQTVGHSGLTSIASALGLPLYTHEIKGTALELGAEYGDREGGAAAGSTGAAGASGGGRKGDETEDLYELLLKVKAAHPNVQAVSCGAILSNYQRVRVEHVCSRLRLTPVAYLWERGQRELLGEMVKAGMTSLLVKVAGAGLQVDHLGLSLAEMEPTLHRLNAKYQLHICGEGGEYETFTVDCPIFRREVVLDKTTTVLTDPSPFSTIAHLHLDTCSLGALKSEEEETFEQTRERLRGIVTVPPVLDGRSLKVLTAARISGEGEGLKGLSLAEEEKREEVVYEGQQSTSRREGEWLYFGEVMAPTPSEEEEMSIEDEVRGCFAELEALLTTHSLTLLHLTHLTLYLSPPCMSLFPRINAIYTTYFGTSPPTRACVSIHPSSFPSSRWMKLEGLACSATGRQCLHVQSLSYWAPANIGPYSQGILSSSSRLFIAGQIPLLPSSLTLPPPEEEFGYSVALSLQHVRRAKEAVAEGSGRWNGWTEGGVCWIGKCEREGEWSEKVAAARRGWREWERRLGAPSLEEEEDSEEDDEESKAAPILFVQAEELPRGAAVEWQVTFATGLVEGGPAHGEEEEDSDEEEEGASRRSRRAESWANEKVQSEAASPLVYQCSPSNGTASVVNAILACNLEHIAPPSSLSSLSTIHSIKAFHLPHVSLSQIRQLASTLFGLPTEQLPALSTVAVGRISSSEGKEGAHEVGFVVTAEVREL
ncbi:hypothetical protein BCR35DRAFT_302670 [Leucosporidium creatinivorum]|uniref:Diphthine--ammonia ligase n=1 Tax=Leucosporidium creatinivorum TaxID=106004 RepID=A0A1Y2FR14_9BASI|nr:hypothetical protein BCR35DRAFT_302670 [Leucosporidium creatinivorum]